MIQWYTQVDNFTTNLKVKIYLPELSAKTNMTWNCHMDDSAKGRYTMILGRDILKLLGLNLKFSKHIIKSDDGPLKGSSLTIVDLGTYEFKISNTGKLHLKNHL